MTDLLSKERLEALHNSYAEDKRIQEQFGDGDYANESGDIMRIIEELLQRREAAEKPVAYKWDSPLGLRLKESLPASSNYEIKNIKPLFEAPSLTSAEQERLEAYDRAAKEPVVVNDDMALAFFRAITDESVSSDDVDECKIGLRAAFANISPPLPVVPDEMSFNDAAAFILKTAWLTRTAQLSQCVRITTAAPQCSSL
ncbi:hypothetical protein ABRQ00_11280 [Pectobacterium aroidearum]|uniref:hypothetical protein n=1 Tax=Pectobacterium aroidearum TaxID=1201031 RepID=UPI002FCC0324